jgi:hypothetical protein
VLVGPPESTIFLKDVIPIDIGPVREHTQDPDFFPWRHPLVRDLGGVSGGSQPNSDSLVVVAFGYGKEFFEFRTHSNRFDKRLVVVKEKDFIQ